MIYKFGEKSINRLGVSAQYGGLYNLDTEKTGDHHGIALHYERNWGRWNLKAQAMNVAHNPENLPGESRETLQMGAYGFPYSIAADFNIYSLAVSRNIPVELGPISNLQFYNDFGYMDKKVDRFEDSFMNVTGVLITAGQLYTYIDYAADITIPGWEAILWMILQREIPMLNGKRDLISILVTISKQ
ncbi:hypothetical protein [Christiangramia salexigens]|uniref:hypothetical protein n=1 Tax=Christiangramia salexigens TaxID=1913577 RepID=UPI0026D97909